MDKNPPVEVVEGRILSFGSAPEEKKSGSCCRTERPAAGYP